MRIYCSGSPCSQHTFMYSCYGALGADATFFFCVGLESSVNCSRTRRVALPYLRRVQVAAEGRLRSS